MRSLILVAFSTLALVTACGDDPESMMGTDGGTPTSDAGGGGLDADVADLSPTELSNSTLTVTEDGDPPLQNVWSFPAPATGQARLLVSAGADVNMDFPFTYEKTGATTGTITFDVEGNDVYRLTFETAETGTFVEQFESDPEINGTFVLVFAE